MRDSSSPQEAGLLSLLVAQNGIPLFRSPTLNPEDPKKKAVHRFGRQDCLPLTQNAMKRFMT